MSTSPHLLFAGGPVCSSFADLFVAGVVCFNCLVLFPSPSSVVATTVGLSHDGWFVVSFVLVVVSVVGSVFIVVADAVIEIGTSLSSLQVCADMS